MNKSELIAVRSYIDSDLNLILATWLRGLFYSDTLYSEIPKNVFMSEYRKILIALLTKSDTVVNVACLKDDPEVVLGYSILSNEAKCLHWVYVKKNWRGIGLAKDLVPSDITAATHTTKVGISIMKKKGLAFNPFLMVT